MATQEVSFVFHSSPMFADKDKGFYLKDDKIIPNVDLRGSDDFIPQLYLKTTSRYFSVYEEDKHRGLTYAFYSKAACHKIYQFFDENGEGIDVYKQIPSFLEDPNLLPDWLTKGMVDEEDVVGMVTIEGAISNQREGIFALLLRKPIKNKKPYMFDFYEVLDYQKIYMESKYLNTYSTKVLVWAFIHDLKKLSDFGNKQIMNDEENAKVFGEFIKANYENLTNEQKDECVILYPDIYKKYTPSNEIYQRLVADTVMSMAIIIRRWGIAGTYAVATIVGDEMVSRLMVTTIKKIDRNKTITFTLPSEYNFPLIVSLVFMNLMYSSNIPVKAQIGYWLYYLLYDYRKRCLEEELPFINTLLVFTLRNNSNSFSKLINVIKQVTFNDEYVTKGFFGTKVRKFQSTWSNYDDFTCIYELIYHFTGNGESLWQKLSVQEQQFWSKRLDDEIEYESILQHLRGNVGHTVMGMDKQREFYANQVYEFIKSEIEKNNFYLRDFN
ncbi:MAG: hypothetical protein J5663_10910 [Bacteroidaceae bacterium]|nr:hypothetical protein [Bacteroidaceae bacterium]